MLSSSARFDAYKNFPDALTATSAAHLRPAKPSGTIDTVSISLNPPLRASYANAVTVAASSLIAYRKRASGENARCRVPHSGARTAAIFPSASPDSAVIRYEKIRSAAKSATNANRPSGDTTMQCGCGAACCGCFPASVCSTCETIPSNPPSARTGNEFKYPPV